MNFFTNPQGQIKFNTSPGGFRPEVDSNGLPIN